MEEVPDPEVRTSTLRTRKRVEVRRYERAGEKEREEKKERGGGEKERGEEKRERDVGIICVIIYDDLALKAWTQSEPKRERERDVRDRKEENDS